jgi:hypothetical protein
MREDMFKVIVERPRWGVHKAPRTKLRQERTGKSFIGMKRQALLQNAWTKDLNENLRPLERYLWKQRGRKWDDVFSEICASLDTGSTVKMHVREHLDDFVERHICIDRTGKWLGQRGIWGHPRTAEYWHAELYVDPVDGILKEVENLRKRLGLQKMRYGHHQQPVIENRVELSSGSELRKINGVWFNVSFYDQRFEERPEIDCLEVPHENYDARRWHTRLANQWRVVRSKRQLSKKDLKKYGLKGGARVH